MRDLFKIILMFGIVLIVYIYRYSISDFITDDIIYKGSNKVLTYNEYYLDNDYIFVQNIEASSVTNYQEVLNMFYTIINSGDDNYSFYCDYNGCVDDVNNLIEEYETITNINNFVHPYNSFTYINIDVTQSGKINVKTKKLYNDSEKDYVNKYINDFINKNINDSMKDYDKIKLFHDYIINNTIYDTNSDDKIYTAYNLITTGISICSGYSDIMAIYLNTLGIQNYRITSSNHIWNLIKLDGKWYHLDATWDDPVASDGKQYLLHNFFMISTNELLSLDKLEHNFNTDIYKEAL